MPPSKIETIGVFFTIRIQKMISFHKNQWYMFVYRNLTGIGSFIREDGDFVYMLVRMNTAEYILPVHKIHTFHEISRITPECFASIRKIPILCLPTKHSMTNSFRKCVFRPFHLSIVNESRFLESISLCGINLTHILLRLHLTRVPRCLVHGTYCL